MDLNRWARQPTTIHALGVLAAGAGAALAQVTTGNHTVDVVVGILAYVLTHLGIDDHSVGESAASAFVTDLTHVGQTSPAKLLADGAAVAATLQPAPATAQ